MNHPPYFDDEFRCERCGQLCWIDADGVRSAVWCHECNDYALGFDGEEWYYGQTGDAPDQEDR